MNASVTAQSGSITVSLATEKAKVRPLSTMLGLVAKGFVASNPLGPQRELVIEEEDALFETFATCQAEKERSTSERPSANQGSLLFVSILIFQICARFLRLLLPSCGRRGEQKPLTMRIPKQGLHPFKSLTLSQPLKLNHSPLNLKQK